MQQERVGIVGGVAPAGGGRAFYLRLCMQMTQARENRAIEWSHQLYQHSRKGLQLLTARRRLPWSVPPLEYFPQPLPLATDITTVDMIKILILTI